MATEVIIYDKAEDKVVLSNADFGELANDATGTIDISDIRSLSAEKLARLKKEIGTMRLSAETKIGLQTLINETNSVPVIVAPIQQQAVPATGDNTSGDKNNDNLSAENLPIAPVTTFNVIRLIQLGYIPVDKPGTLKSPKWLFYGPNIITQWGNGKVSGWMLDWSGGKENNAYRAMLESDISNINSELRAYQENTKKTFGMKVELEKQLTLLESLKSEGNPKKIMEIGNEYVKSRSVTHFNAGAVAHNDPAVRKSIHQLDAEVVRAEGRTQITEDRIKAREMEINALKSKGAKDITGKTRDTQEEIEEKNKKRTERATSLSDRRIADLSKQLSIKQADVQKFQQEFEAAKAKIVQTGGYLAALRLNDRGRLVADINAEMSSLGLRNKTNDKTFQDLEKELKIVNQRIAYETELRMLGSLDSRGNPIASIAPAISVVHETFTDLETAKIEVKRLEGEIKTSTSKKEKLLKEASKKGQNNLGEHTKEIDRTEKKIAQGRADLIKRQEAEIRIAEVNGKIKNIETKLAASPAASERLKLESNLRELYAVKNGSAQAFESALKSNKGKNDSQTKTVVEGQRVEVQKELDKLNQLGKEMDLVKTKIDAIQLEAQVAKDTLNKEGDSVKAKKLRDEMPARINAANQQILELNNAGMKLTQGSGINWNKIPDIELKSVLKKNLFLAKFLATPQGLITRAETFGQTPGGQKTMKVVYGGLKYVAIAGAVRTVGNEITTGDMKAAGLDAVDAGMGFIGMIPGGNIISGVYDIGMAGKQFTTGTDINGRKVSTSQSFVRLGFGVVGLIPIVGNIVKGVGAARGAIKVVGAMEKVESVANVTMKGVVLAQAGTLTYDVMDVTTNMFRGDPVSTAMRVVRGQEQPGIIFHKTNQSK